MYPSTHKIPIHPEKHKLFQLDILHESPVTGEWFNNPIGPMMLASRCTTRLLPPQLLEASDLNKTLALRSGMVEPFGMAPFFGFISPGRSLKS